MPSSAQLPQMTATTLTSFPYDRNSKFSLKFTLENTWLTIHRVLLSYGCTWEHVLGGSLSSQELEV